VDSKSVQNIYSSFQYKVEKQCILLTFIIRIYHDARSCECRSAHVHVFVVGKGKFCMCWILILIFIFIYCYVQSDSESDLSQAQRLNVTVASRVNCLMRPTISSQNKMTSLGGSKGITIQNARRRGLSAAYSAGIKKGSAFVLNLHGTVNCSRLYGQTSVHELNSFLKFVRKLKCS